MKKVFTHENALIVHNAKNIIENKGIAYELKNEFAAAGAGELSTIDTWPELWVATEDYHEAKRALAPLSEDTKLPSWLCAACGEHNEGSFEVCWQCQTAAPGHSSGRL